VHDSGKGAVALILPADKPQAMARDPFKDYIDKQQQGTVNQTSPAQLIQSAKVMNGKAASTVPLGTDTFKAFLEAQGKAKPEASAISPFTSVK
jgi:hypothetical protein